MLILIREAGWCCLRIWISAAARLGRVSPDSGRYRSPASGVRHAPQAVAVMNTYFHSCDKRPPTAFGKEQSLPSPQSYLCIQRPRPNSTNGVCPLNDNPTISGNLDRMIVSTDGRVLQSGRKLQLFAGEQQLQLDLRMLPAGPYVIIGRSTEGRFAERVVLY